MQQEMRFRQESDSEALLERELLPGEQLLWSGRPLRNSKNTTSPGSVFLILTIVFGAVALLMLVLGTIFLAVFTSRGSAVASAVFFLVGSVFLFMVIFFAIFAIVFRWSPRQLLYAVTDQRAIIIRSGRRLTVDSYARETINHITRIEHADGSGDLIFAPPYTNPSYNASYGAGSRGYGTGSNMYGMGGAGRFIGIPNVRDVERMLRGSSRL